MKRQTEQKVTCPSTKTNKNNGRNEKLARQRKQNHQEPGAPIMATEMLPQWLPGHVPGEGLVIKAKAYRRQRQPFQ